MDNADPNEPVYPCPICGRKFVKSSLEKHESACRKLATLHRKPFDSGKQRANGSDLTYAAIKKAQNEKAKNGGVFPRPQTNWRERHGNFIDAVSSSKRVDYALKTGAPLPPPPKTAVPSDYVQCEYCSRNFNAAAAERHIPFCREQTTRKQGGKSSAGNRGLTSNNYRSLPSKHEGRKQESSSRNGSAERKTTTRGRDGSLSRARRDDSNDLTNRRKSLETRSQLTTGQANNRTTSLSAGTRPALPPMTPSSKRSSSAKRDLPPNPTTHQRLKTPAPKTTTTASASRSGSGSSSRTRTRDESRESRLSQAKSNSRNNSRSRIF
ncbi:Protein CBG14627 [Caenorhabditis briggsae]|uniref:Zinc finger C2HC domain-containing protein CBG14627 n=1 Tax=Caenorhabditis briggsae TaxID=6238 RepID=ZC21A_CAEBR|nr:Protein CBG14627 [Caenorhabditis briggsae]Q618K0.2 RecName: Full=Zinc finger C2HC domain-containing protein CBG14627 [Caenorhabditis briggsae]CAP33089.3 Protein CBG14627 [Caenorhabditis briggsae]